jgi:hypothetical protein
MFWASLLFFMAALVHLFRREVQQSRLLASENEEIVLAPMQPLLAGRPIVANFPTQPLFTACNSLQIQSCVLNLIENAHKYSPKGAPIELRGWARDGQVFFSVRDHGPGVSAGDLPRIFEKFYRGRTACSTRGTGLDLAVCQAVIRAHHGCLWVENRGDGGAEFTFSLPALACDDGSEGDPWAEPIRDAPAEGEARGPAPRRRVRCQLREYAGRGDIHTAARDSCVQSASGERPGKTSRQSGRRS